LQVEHNCGQRSELWWMGSRLTGCKCDNMHKCGHIQEEDCIASDRPTFTDKEKKHQCQKKIRVCHNWNSARRELPAKIYCRSNGQTFG
jgi:hypothetical protein